MPGLVGFTISRSRTDAPAVLQSLRDTLVRFPFHVEDELFADGSIAASRVHNGAVPSEPQPAVHRDVRVWLDGEIFAEGDVDVAAGGAERLAAAFANSPGRSSFVAFNGGFAASVYDAARGRVHLVADRTGFRHLYYLVHDGALWWSSEIKSFCAVPGFTPRIRASAVESFFRQGYLSGNETWLEGVELLAGGTVATFDIARASLSLETYWRYDDIEPIDPGIGIDAMVNGLGERFLTAVRRRCAAGRIGLMLSGGLDSRAVLAAIPAGVTPLHAITFGQAGSFDVRWGRRAAHLRGASHHVVPVGQGDWLTPRLSGVWWTDGQMNLLDMHTIATASQREWFTVNVSGFVGDLVAGGSYVRPGTDERDAMNTRCRRFTSVGIRARLPFYEMRLPFTDNDVMDYAFGLPRDLRAGAFLYHRMLLQFFPRYYRSMPWQSTGVPINWPPGLARLARRMIRRSDLAARSIERRTGMRIPFKRQFVDYAAWLRREPARSRVEALIMDSHPRSAAYGIPQNAADLWRRHLAGENHAGMLGRHVTFEVWVRQLFDSELRPRNEN